MTHPYSDLPPDAFWRPAVSDRSAFEISGLWKPRFRIKKRARIATAGSCFAQHISRALVTRGYHWIDAEPAPAQMTEAARRDYHYGTFSARTGNIYTPRMLEQWLSWATAEQEAPDLSWRDGERFFDPFRPGVEKDGFASHEDLLATRDVTITALRRAIEEASVLIFTLGLTESWQDRKGGFEYAICPGTMAGQFDPDHHAFVNHGFSDTLKSLRSALGLARQLNPKLRVILTVSPVPLTATASGDHVLTASSYSKSVLRAVAGEILTTHRFVDYFPSYEIITHPAFRGMFFQPNMRGVTQQGVNFVMDQFFGDQTRTFSRSVEVHGPYGTVETRVIGPDQPLPRKAIETAEAQEDVSDEILCEEEMLDAFSR